MKRASLVLALVASCAPTRSETISPVVEHVRERIGVDASAVAKSQDIVNAEVDALVAQPLTMDTAAKIALIKNPDLVAAYERLGVSEGALVQSGLFANPVATGLIRFGEPKPDFEVSVTEDITSMIFALAKHGAAEADRDAAMYETAALAIDTAAHARTAVVRAVTSSKVAKLRDEAARVEDTALSLANRMHDAGNLSDRDLLEAEARDHEAHLAALDAKRDDVMAQQDLFRVLDDPRARVPVELPPDAMTGAKLDALDAGAMAKLQPLRIEAVHARGDAVERSLGYRGVERFIPGIAVGAGVEQRQGQIEVGPSAAVTLPVVDLSQGEIAAHEAQLRALESESRGIMAREVTALTRLHADADVVASRAREAHALAEVRAKLVDETRRHYNAMSASLRDLFDARRAAADASIVDAKALEDAWLTRIEIDQLVAGGGP
jgi:cobalt-zinc-cadmium efflux system outer membrane protein